MRISPSPPAKRRFVPRRLTDWAQQRLADAEPTIGATGPILWGLAIACVVVGAWVGTFVDDAFLAFPSMIALAAVLGLTTAPSWMLSVAVRRHYLRNAALREEAQSMRVQLQSAFVEGRIAEGDFEQLDRELDDVRRGKTANDLAAAAETYMRGVGWSLAWAGLLIGGSIFSVSGWLLDYDEGHEATGLTQSMVSISLAVVLTGAALAVLFMVAAQASRRRARRTGQATEARMLELRRTRLDARRG